MKRISLIISLLFVFSIQPLAIFEAMAADTTIKGTTSDDSTASLEVTDVSNASLLYVRNDGNVGIGEATPDEELHIVGNIKMVDGNQGAGKLLTSDVNGVGSWQDPAGGTVDRLTSTTSTLILSDDTTDQTLIGDLGNLKIDATTYIQPLDDISIANGLKIRDGYLHVGDGGTPNKVDGDGDLYIEDELEVKGCLYFGSELRSTSSVFQLKTSNGSCYYVMIDEFRPISFDNYADLGSSSKRWKNLYLGTTISDGTNTITMGAPITFSGGISAGAIIGTSLSTLERSADPSEPAEGECIIWMSDGTGKGDDGDVLIASKAAGTTNWATLFDHSAGAPW